MSKQERGSRSSLFLIELIIVLFFFLLVASVCIQVFARAYTTSQSSRELSHAQNQCAGVAEVFGGTDGTIEELLIYFPEGKPSTDGMELFYDKAFSPCTAEDAVYTLSVKAPLISKDAPNMRRASLTFLRGEQSIYTLSVRCHVPLTAQKEAAP